MSSISPAHFSRALAETLAEYGRLTASEVQSTTEAVGAEAKARVTAASPKRRGKYRRGWKVRNAASGSKVSVTVHNRQYQLTHLLEKGHRTRLKHGRYGTKATAAAQPHIGAVNEWAQQELERRIRRALGGG